MIVRPETPADHAGIARVLPDAFGDAKNVPLVDQFRASAAYVPELALVAEV